MSLPEDRIDQWLSYIETLAPVEIDLGLKNMRLMLERMSLQEPSFKTILVAGTNGKGSCVEFLRNYFKEQGYKVGAYTSPHLFRFHERIRIKDNFVTDEELLDAFKSIEALRGDIPLTFFEFTTLSCFKIFHESDIEYAILEVGLGGRLDATNALDPFACLITGISIDHTQWLGKDLDSIGREKAGIFRDHIPAVFGGKHLPHSVMELAKKNSLYFNSYGTEYSVSKKPDGFYHYKHIDGYKLSFKLPNFGGKEQALNVASCLTLARLITDQIPFNEFNFIKAIDDSDILGRFTKNKHHNRNWYFDVAHNEESAVNLFNNVFNENNENKDGKTIAIFSLMGDKNIERVTELFLSQIDQWILYQVDNERSMKIDELNNFFSHHKAQLHIANSLQDCIELALKNTTAEDRIIVFGSFYLIGPLMKQLGYNLN